MSGVRLGLGRAGFALASLAALASAGGLAGGVWGWADVPNHFAPLWLVAALLGGLVARAALARGEARTVATLAAAIAVVAAGSPILAETVKGARQPAPRGQVVKVMTFNRWWGGQPMDAARAIRRSGADVVTLQEANGFETVSGTLRDLYPYQLPCPRLCDTFILSKRPILNSGEVTPPQHDARDLVWARIDQGGGKSFTIATVHLFWPLPPWIQRRQRVQLAQMAAELPRDDLIVTGDFNAAPWSFAIRDLDRRLAPLTRRTHGTLTFSADWPVPLLALDQVYAGPAWRSAKVERLPKGGSDHYPLLVTLGR